MIIDKIVRLYIYLLTSEAVAYELGLMPIKKCVAMLYFQGSGSKFIETSFFDISGRLHDPMPRNFSLGNCL